MSLADDLQKIEQLRSSGSLTDAEFEQAKKKLLAPSLDESHFSEDEEQGGFLSDNQEKRKLPSCSEYFEDEDQSLGRAANRYVSFQILMSIIGLLVFLFLFFAVFLPKWSGFPGGSSERIEWKHTP